MSTDVFYYIDTSVIGGYFDSEFAEVTRRFWDRFQSRSFSICISDLVVKELEGAPEPVRNLVGSITEGLVILSITEEMLLLAEKYVLESVVSPHYRDDAVHVAVATLACVEALISWNFRHLVNARREENFNRINRHMGYGAIRIVSPREVLEHGYKSE